MFVQLILVLVHECIFSILLKLLTLRIESHHVIRTRRERSRIRQRFFPARPSVERFRARIVRRAR